ncbi:MAG: hypothetical protein IBX72_00310 [Nitrospirae bacterium]|nr:hypothetical protein [Nitrospirota bacterium]
MTERRLISVMPYPIFLIFLTFAIVVDDWANTGKRLNEKEDLEFTKGEEKN